MIIKMWLLQAEAEQAFRTGQAYRDGQIYRHTTKYRFKYMPYILPDWVLGLDLETHRWFEATMKHAFRAGLNSKRGV